MELATALTMEEIEAGKNYYDFNKPEKYRKAMPTQEELTAILSDRKVTLDDLLHKVCPVGYIHVVCDGELMPYHLSWDGMTTNFKPACYKEYSGLLKSIVEIHPQGFLYINYSNVKKAHDFICDMQGLSLPSRFRRFFY